MRIWICLLMLVGFLVSCDSSTPEETPPSVQGGNKPIAGEFILTWYEQDSALVSFLDTLQKLGVNEINRCNCKPIRVLLSAEDALVTIDGVANGSGSKARTGSSGDPDLTPNTLIPNIDLYFPELTIDKNEVDSAVKKLLKQTNTGNMLLFAITDSSVDFAQLRIERYKWNPENNDNAVNKERRGRLEKRDCEFDLLVDAPSDVVNHGDMVALTLLEQLQENTLQLKQNYNIQLASISVLNKDDRGDLFTAMCGLEQAASIGPDAIVASWGFTKPDYLSDTMSNNYDLGIQEFQKLVQMVTSNGTPIVAAAGNDGVNINDKRFYPAYFAKDTTAFVLAVGAVNENGRTDYSNYGKGIVSFGANGESSLFQDENEIGTSFAAPRVAAFIGILRRSSENKNFSTTFSAFKRRNQPISELGIYIMDNDSRPD